MESSDQSRVDGIRDAVRQAVGRLRGLERRVVEGYHFDGRSMGQIAKIEGVAVNRVVTAHRQAFRNLREMLAPFVARTFGIGAAIVASCPICTAAWRIDAEAIIDGKTADVTWGQIMTRIERATGWRAKSPQVLIVHKRKHGVFQSERIVHDEADIARGARGEDQYLDRFEVEFGEDGEVDGPPVGGCVPDAPMDGAAAPGGNG